MVEDSAGLRVMGLDCPALQVHDTQVMVHRTFGRKMPTVQKQPSIIEHDDDDDSVEPVEMPFGEQTQVDPETMQ